MAFLPIRAFIIPLGAALAILAIASQSTHGRVSGTQQAICTVDACVSSVIR
jgi:hypothetical protein